MRVVLRRVFAAAAIIGVGLLGSPSAALAGPGWGSVDCGQTPSPDCDISAGSGRGAGGATPGGTEHGDTSSDTAPKPDRPSAAGENLSCGYQPSGYSLPPGAAGSGALSGGGVWLDGVCSANGAIRTPEYVAEVTPAEIARLARSQLRLPAPTIAANPVGDQLVNLPTWLWLSGGWRPVSATATVPGVSVTATATPTSVTWSVGDGAVVTCAGPGTPYRPGGDPRASSPDCGYTYRTSSARQPGQAFLVTATLHWTVRWSGAGQGGTFPDLITTGNTALRVAESQALNNGSG